MPNVEIQFTGRDDLGEAFADIPNITTDQVLEIGPGVTARQPLMLSDMGPIAVVFEIAATVSAGVASSLIANAIWDRVCGRKPESVRINRTTYRLDSEGQLREVILEELDVKNPR